VLSSTEEAGIRIYRMPCFLEKKYEESLKMAPFEMLYGGRCWTPLFWNKTRERKVFGPDILQGADIQVRMVRENLKNCTVKIKELC
jgi:hypothetical protein